LSDLEVWADWRVIFLFAKQVEYREKSINRDRLCFCKICNYFYY